MKRILVAESLIALDATQLSDQKPRIGPVLDMTSSGVLGMPVRLENELGVELRDGLFVNRLFRAGLDVIDVVAEGISRHRAKASAIQR